MGSRKWAASVGNFGFSVFCSGYPTTVGYSTGSGHWEVGSEEWGMKGFKFRVRGSVGDRFTVRGSVGNMVGEIDTSSGPLFTSHSPLPTARGEASHY